MTERAGEGATVESHRDALGRRVREVWVAWAQRQPNPKPSWLVPYDDLSEPDKEADRCIGSALWGDGFADGERAAAWMRRVTSGTGEAPKSDLLGPAEAAES